MSKLSDLSSLGSATGLIDRLVGLYGTAGAAISGTLTAGTIPKATAPKILGDSIMSEAGSLITVAGGISATGNVTIGSLSGSGSGVVAVDNDGLLSWLATPSTSPGGATTNVQYNNAGAFGGDANFIYDGAGNISIGKATFEAIRAAYVNIQLGGNAILSGFSAERVGADTFWSQNAYYAGAGWLAISDGLSSRITQSAGAVFIQVSNGSDNADAAVGWITPLQIQNDGSIDISTYSLGYDGSAGGLSFDASNNITTSGYVQINGSGLYNSDSVSWIEYLGFSLSTLKGAWNVENHLTVAGGNLSVSSGNILITGSNNELRFYESVNYVGFEAPALDADQIWVLPNADGSASDYLQTDGSGNLTWAPEGYAYMSVGDSITGGTAQAVLFESAGNLLAEDAGNFDYDGAGTLTLETAYNTKDATGVYQINSATVLRTLATGGTCVGVGAGTNATGNYNTILGYNAGIGAAAWSGASNVIVGTNISQAFNGTTAATNVLIGSAIVSSSTALGNDNTFIGNSIATNALSTCTTNIAIGPYVMQGATSAYQNIVMGYAAGQGLTSGHGNMAFGYIAGQYLGGGVNNMMIGSGAGRYNSGSSNVYIGDYAGAGTGAYAVDSTVCIGSYSGAEGPGPQAVFIGTSSGQTSSGSACVYIGYLSGQLSYAGHSNTCIGYYTGQKLIGRQNTLIGYRAGGFGTTWNKHRNIFIGFESGYNATHTGLSDQLVIANSNTTTPLIYGIFPNTSLTFNATNVTYTGNILMADDKSLNFGAVPDVTMLWENASGDFDVDIAGTLTLDGTGVAALTFGNGTSRIQAGSMSGVLELNGSTSVDLSYGGLGVQVQVAAGGLILSSGVTLLGGSTGVVDLLTNSCNLKLRRWDQAGTPGIGADTINSWYHTDDSLAYLVLEDNDAGTTYNRMSPVIGGYQKSVRDTANRGLATEDEQCFGNTDGGAFTYTLPAAPTQGQYLRFANTGTSANDLTIDRNGKNIRGAAANMTITDGVVEILVYDSTDGWY